MKADKREVSLSAEALEAKRLYHREWQRRNKDKVKAANMRYWEKKAKAAQEREAAAE
jgi:hypothetical protein